MALYTAMLAAGLSGCAKRVVTVSIMPPLLPARITRSPQPASPAQPASDLVAPGRPMPGLLFRESFDHLDLTRWRDMEVKGRTQYAVEAIEGSSSLKADSRAGASIMLYAIRFHPKQYKWLTWRWRVEKAVDKENLAERSGSDAAARVYVYFDTPGLPWQKRSMDYVWSTNRPIGSRMDSAFSKAAKIITAESGNEYLGQWRMVSRNLEQDYRLCYGQDPPDVVAIGLMTDTDNTRSEALAYFDDIMVTREQPPEASR